jgi:hypothetical protein
VFVGSFLPWATVSTAFGSLSASGTEGDGKITLVCGLVIAVAGLVDLLDRASPWVIALLAGAAAAIIGVIDLANVGSRLGGFESAYVHPSIGIGLWVVLSGAVVTLVGALFFRRPAGR